MCCELHQSLAFGCFCVIRPPRFATILARVDVCRARVGRAGRAISFLVLVFTLERLASLTSCRQGRNHHPFDKEQTLFLVPVRVPKFRLDLVRKEQCSSIDRDWTGSCAPCQEALGTSLSPYG